MKKVFEKNFTSETKNLSAISNFLKKRLQKIRLDKETIDEILIAADEAATNIILHSYKKRKDGYIRLRLELQDDKIILSFFDNGDTFDPDKITPPEFSKSIGDRKIGGLGIFLMKKFMDEVTFYLKNTNLKDENEVRMIKYLKNKKRKYLLRINKEVK